MARGLYLAEALRKDAGVDAAVSRGHYLSVITHGTS
jgi:hypothetical protein